MALLAFLKLQIRRERTPFPALDQKVGSHGYCVFGSNRGSFDRFENPTMASRNESIVATPAIFMVGSVFEEGHVLRQ